MGHCSLHIGPGLLLPCCAPHSSLACGALRLVPGTDLAGALEQASMSSNRHPKVRVLWMCYFV